MNMLILCSSAGETKKFLQAERALAEKVKRQKRMPRHSPVQTLHLKELPAPSDAAGIEQLAKDSLQALGAEGASFQTESITHGGFPFVVVYCERNEEPAPSPVRKPAGRAWKILAGLAAALLVLAAAYFGTERYFVNTVNARYALGQCADVTRLAGTIEAIYPQAAFPSLAKTFEQRDECLAYNAAADVQQQGDWATAYAAYQDYLTKYPNGALVVSAKKNAAETLWNLSKQQCETGQYAKGMENLSTFLADYDTSPLAAEAKALLPVCAFELGKSLQGSQKFDEALEKFQAAAQADLAPDNPESVSNQVRETIPTLYLQWADSLVIRNDFESALEKYNLAMEADANPDNPASILNQAKEKAASLPLQWAKYLVGQGEFEEAVSQFEIYIASVPAGEEASARDALAEGYLRWAEALRGEEDFWGALDKIGLAEDHASGEATRTGVGETRAETYAAFAASSGSQSRQVMDEAAKELAENQRLPELPIFGTDKEHARIYVYSSVVIHVSGIEEAAFELRNMLPSEILPTMPGEMRYVAYVVRDEVYKSNQFYTYVLPKWIVSLIDVRTGAEVEKRGFNGTPGQTTSWGLTVMQEQPPGPEALAELVAWLRTYIQ